MQGRRNYRKKITGCRKRGEPPLEDRGRGSGGSEGKVTGKAERDCSITVSYKGKNEVKKLFRRIKKKKPFEKKQTYTLGSGGVFCSELLKTDNARRWAKLKKGGCR